MKAIEIIWKAVRITNIIADNEGAKWVYSCQRLAESSRNTMKQIRQLKESAKSMYNRKMLCEKFGPLPYK